MLALLFLLKEVKPFPGPKKTKFLTFDNLFFLFTNLRKKADGEGGGGGGVVLQMVIQSMWILCN